MATRDQQIAFIEEVLDRARLARPSARPAAPISFYRAAEPYLDIEGVPDDYEIPMFATPYDIDYKLDVSAVHPLTDQDDGISLSRCRFVPVRSLRGRGRIPPSRLPVLEYTFGFVRRHGKYVCGRNYYGHWRGGWRHLESHRFGVPDDGFCIRHAHVAMGVQFVRQMQWRAVVGYAGGLSLSLACDPIGARELFRLRDIPEGAKRRRALRNWVSEHWRTKRDDPEEKTRVMRHLRGATKFTWNGMHVEIQPSADDLVQLEKLREERRAS